MRALLLGIIAISSIRCSRPEDRPVSTVAFDSARLVEVEGIIDSGYIHVRTSDPVEQEKKIRAQLKYTVGQLNALRGAPSLKTLSVTILGSSPIPEETDESNVTYTAKFLATWPRGVAIPDSVNFYYPLQDEQKFIATYLNDGGDAQRCMDRSAHAGVDASNSWYYFRPEKSTCEIFKNKPSDVVLLPLKFSLASTNTTNQSPEYKKIWEDGRLVATLIFGRNDENTMSNDDAGISAYRASYQGLIRTFGKPLESNLPLDLVLPDASQPSARMTLNTEVGPLDIDLELVNKLGSTHEEEFTKRYEERTKISDYVSYSGHSGLGSNIGKLMTMGQFVKGQYQIFRFNGCDSYSYLTDGLRDAHAAVNPDESPDKYIDILTNSQPSKFATGPTEAVYIIKALIAQKETYREIMARMDPSQQTNVSGEQDNEL